MSSFLDEAKTESVRHPRTPCSFGMMLGGLTAAQRAEVQDALDDVTIKGAAIARVLARRYPTAPKQAVVTRHRRGECSCG